MKPCQTNSSSQDFDSSFFVFDFFDFFDDISIHFMWSCSGGCGRFCHCAVASKTAAVTELSCSHNPLLSCHPGCWTVAVWGMVRHKVYKHIRFVVGDVFFVFEHQIWCYRKVRSHVLNIVELINEVPNPSLVSIVKNAKIILDHFLPRFGHPQNVGE